METFAAAEHIDGPTVSCALEKALVHQDVILIGENVDLIVLLLRLVTSSATYCRNILFMKPGRETVPLNFFRFLH